MQIKTVSFEQIKEVWRSRLWQGRVSEIKGYSAMTFMGDNSGRFKDQPQVFLAGIIDNKIVAVNSLHLAESYMARSRGLWVDDAYRGQGFGLQMLEETSKQAEYLGAFAIWSFPRQTSWSTYERAGYIQMSPWMSHGEFGPNCYAIKRLNVLLT